MITRIVLYIGNADWLPSPQVWYDAFKNADPKRIEITTERRADADAALVSISRCEKFGCRTGVPNEPSDVMHVYDSYQYEPPNQFFPRYQISNAFWRPEPDSLVAQIRARLHLLYDTLVEFDAHSEHQVRSVNIDCSTLGWWPDFSEDVQAQAVAFLNDEIPRLFKWK